MLNTPRMEGGLPLTKPSDIMIATLERQQLKLRPGATRCGDPPGKEPILDGVDGQGIDDLVHAGESGQLSLWPISPPTHPAKPVLALRRYQSRHEVMMTSRIVDVTSPIVNTHCSTKGTTVDPVTRKKKGDVGRLHSPTPQPRIY